MAGSYPYGPTNCNFVTTPPAGFCFVAGARVGDNMAVAGGEPELTLGRSLTANRVVAQANWDAQLSDGLDSGWVGAELVANAGGGAGGVTWTASIGGVAVALSYAGVSYGSITKVELRSAVQGPNRRFSWKNVVATFYRNGQPVDSQVLPDECNPNSDTFGGPPGASASKMVRITPGVANCDKLWLTVMFRMEATGSTLPGPDDLQGAIYVSAANCEAA